jgi:hypothetical protein
MSPRFDLGCATTSPSATSASPWAACALARLRRAGGALHEREPRTGYFVIEPTAVAQPAPPTDAQLTTFMQENAQRLTPGVPHPDRGALPPAQVAANLPVDR